MIKKPICAFLFLVLLNSGTLQAKGVEAKSASPTAKSVQKLLTLVSFPEMINEMLAPLNASTKLKIETRLKNEVTNKNISLSQEELLKNERSSIFRDMDHHFSWQGQQDIVAEVYSKNFSQKEINDLIAFAKTKTGKAFWKKILIIENQLDWHGERNGIKFMKEQDEKVTNLILNLNK